MKKFLLSAVALLFCVAASAQFVTERSEITVSYGVAPTTTWIDAYGGVLLEAFTGLKFEPSSWGAATVGYNFRLTKRISLGLQASYSSNKDDISINNRANITIRNSYWSLMPNVKYSWFRAAGIVSFYSRIGAGVLFSNSQSEGQSESETHFAFQFSPIGVEVGHNLAAYAEAGVGVSGCLLVGARYRF